MIEESPYMLIEWKEIAKLTHYSPGWVRKKFGRELKVMGLVTVKYINYTNQFGVIRRKRAAIGGRYLLERYFLDKRQQGEY